MRRFPSIALLGFLLARCCFAGYLTGVAIQPSAPGSSDIVTLEVRGDLPNPCFTTPEATAVVRQNVITVNVITRRLETFAACVQVIQPFTASVIIGRLAPGAYSVNARLLFDGAEADVRSMQFSVASGTPASDAMVAIGSVAHLASGGGWSTVFTIVNPDPFPVSVRLAFLDPNGGPLEIPLYFPLEKILDKGSSVSRTIAPGASLYVETAAPESQSPVVGWAHVSRAPSLLAVVFHVSGAAVFRGKLGGLEEEASAPFQNLNPASWVLPFDNTGGRSTGIALANISDQGADVNIIIRDANGDGVAEGRSALPPGGHRAVILSAEFPQTSERRGTVEFQRPAGGQIGVFGLRAGPSASLAWIPPIPR